MYTQKENTILESKMEKNEIIKTKAQLAIQLQRLKEQLILLWNKIQPASDNAYNMVYTLTSKGVDTSKLNPYDLSYAEHKHLSFILSMLIQVAEDIEPAFRDLCPRKEWLSFESRHSMTSYDANFLEVVPHVITSQLHVELIELSSIKNAEKENFRSISIMNGLLTLFTQSFERVEKEGNHAIKRFCNYLIPADDEHACIDARTRMAFNYAMSEEFSTEFFSDIMEEASRATLGESYFAVLVYFVQNYWGKYLKADTGTNAICTQEHIQKYGKRICTRSYELIKKGITIIFFEEPGCDFVFQYKKLNTVKKIFDFFTLVLKEPQCIKPINAIEYENKVQWQKAFDELMLIRNPVTGKNLLGFAVKDCSANQDTVRILLNNLSNSVFKKAIVEAGIIWNPPLCVEVANRLRTLNEPFLADSIEISSVILDGTMPSFKNWVVCIKEIFNNPNHSIQSDVFMFASQELLTLINNPDYFAEVILLLEPFLSQPELIQLIYYSDAIKIFFEIPGDEGLAHLKKTLCLFASNETKYTNTEKNFFDSIMNIKSELRGKNFFGMLVGELGVSVKQLTNRMSPYGRDKIGRKAYLRWSATDLSIFLDSLNTEELKKTLFSFQRKEIFINDKDPKSCIQSILSVVAKKIAVQDWLQLMEYHGVFSLTANSADLFEFLISEIIKNSSCQEYMSILCFFYKQDLIPDISSLEDSLNIRRFKALLPFLINGVRQKFTAEEQKIYNQIMGKEIPKLNTNVLGFIGLHCDATIEKNPLLIKKISPEELVKYAKSAHVYWGSQPLESITSVLKQDPTRAIQFFKECSQLFNAKQEFSYFSSQLTVLLSNLSCEQVIEILKTYQNQILVVLDSPGNMQLFMDLLSKHWNIQQLTSLSIQLLQACMKKTQLSSNNLNSICGYLIQESREEEVYQITKHHSNQITTHIKDSLFITAINTNNQERAKELLDLGNIENSYWYCITHQLDSFTNSILDKHSIGQRQLISSLTYQLENTENKNSPLTPKIIQKCVDMAQKNKDEQFFKSIYDTLIKYKQNDIALNLLKHHKQHFPATISQCLFDAVVSNNRSYASQLVSCNPIPIYSSLTKAHNILYLAITQDMNEVVEYCLKKHLDQNTLEFVITSLLQEKRNIHDHYIKTILEQHTVIHLKKWHDTTTRNYALHWAILNKKPKEILSILCLAEADISLVNKEDKTPLDLALESGQFDTAYTLVTQHIPNLNEEKLRDICNTLIKNHHIELMISLLKRYPHQFLTPFKTKLLSEAIMHRNSKLSLELLALGADPNCKVPSTQDTNKLWWAIHGGLHEVVDAMLQSNLTNETLELTLLHLIVTKTDVYLPYVRIILQRNPHLNLNTYRYAATHNGILHEAITHQHSIEIIKLLCQEGACVSQTNKANKSPKDLALELGQFDVYIMLSRHKTASSNQVEINVAKPKLTWVEFETLLDETHWQNKILFDYLVSQHLVTLNLSTETQNFIKTHALACFNYLTINHGAKHAANTRRLFLQRILFENMVDKEDLKNEARDYLQGNSVYSQNCLGISIQRGKESRLAHMYNVGLFNTCLGVNKGSFEKLSKKEKKQIKSNCFMIT